MCVRSYPTALLALPAFTAVTSLNAPLNLRTCLFIARRKARRIWRSSPALSLHCRTARTTDDCSIRAPKLFNRRNSAFPSHQRLPIREWVAKESEGGKGELSPGVDRQIIYKSFESGDGYIHARVSGTLSIRPPALVIDARA